MLVIFLNLCCVAGFRGQQHAQPHPTPPDMPDYHGPDPDDAADMELPDQLDLIHAFMAGLCKKSQHDCCCLSALLAELPDPSCSHGQVEAMPVTEARERGLIPNSNSGLPTALSPSK